MPATQESDDSLEQMLDLLLQAEASERPALLAELCSSHPAEAKLLRQRYSALEQMGMLDHQEPGPPAQIGSYTVLEQIGEGGMGVVYRAHQEGLDREVAVKLLRPEFAWLAASRQRFQREGRVVARLEHPAIVPILQFGDHDGQPFLVMRHIAGRSLAEVLTAIQRRDRQQRTTLAKRTGERIVGALREGPDGVDEVAVRSALHGLETRWSRVVARLLLPIAEALAHAHGRGVVHRDVKPSNILLARDGRAFLCDFGLASLADLADHEEQLTRTGALLGSVPYMSPEQIDSTDLDARSDVFSFGSVLYEALLSERAFGSGSQSQTIHAIARSEPSAIAQSRSFVEPDLMAIVARCLEKRPARRYQDGAELAADLRAFLANLPVRARKLTVARRIARLARREPVRFSLGIATAALLLVSASLGGYLVASSDARAAGERQLLVDRVERQLALGFQALFESRPTTAARHFESCLQLTPSSRPASTGLAIARGDAIEQTPTDLPHATAAQLFAHASGRIFAGNHGDRSGAREAATMLQDALLRAPHARPAYHGMLAKAAAAAGQDKLAMRTADAIEQLWPDSATAAYWSGYARIEVDAQQAAAAFERAVQLDPSFAAAWAELGVARLLQQEVEGAERALQEAIERDASNSRTWLNLGLTHQQAGALEQAQAALRRAAGLPDAVPGASYNLGVLLAGSDVAAAVEAFEQTVALAPDYGEAWYNLGVLHDQEGEFAAGHRALLQAVRLRPDWSDAWRQLGGNRARASDARGAADAYRKVVALEPEDRAARAYLDSLLRHLGQQPPASRDH